MRSACLRVIFHLKDKKSPFQEVLTWFLILDKIQDGDHCWRRHRPPAASPPTKYTLSCRGDQRLSTRVKSFEILQHIENSNGWEGGIHCGSMNLHARPRVKSQTFFSFLDGAQLFLATDVTNHVPRLTSSFGLSSRVCRVYPEDYWGSKSKKKKKKRLFKVDLNLANVEADLLLVDRLYYKLATIHVLALLLSHVSHEIWKDSNKKIRWFKNLIICFIYHAYNDVIFLVSLICFNVFTWSAPLKNVHINENIKNRADFAYGIMQKLKTHPALRAELPCFSFLIDKEEKGIYLNHVNLLNPDFWTSQSCFLSSNWFFDCKSVCLLINRWS